MDSEADSLVLDAPTRAALDALRADHRERLERLIDAAAHEQKALLYQAVDDALAIIPGPLRKRVLKLVSS